MDKPKKPNEKLQRQRELKGWSQEKLAEEIGTTQKIVSRWERGESTPLPYYRQKLCKLFGKNAIELGLLDEEAPDKESSSLLEKPVSSIEGMQPIQIFVPSGLPLVTVQIHQQPGTRVQTHSGETEPSKILGPMDDIITELLQPLVENRECAWTYAWGLGEEVSNIKLVYNSAIQYESTMLDDVRQALADWCRKNQTKCNEKKRDPVGALVRLEKAEWSHSAYKYFVLLSPSRYLTYVAIHPHLGKAQLRPLREAHFCNALEGLRNGESLELPSNFALHMAVVSQDGYLLLRRRASDTELYPSAWEAGIGEFMHGPEETPGPEYESGPYHSQFPHFTGNGLPDLFLFLKNAVAEELGYHEARQENFRLYGFAVEYETLAPKLLVVYNADCTLATLLESAKKAKDRARELSSLEFTPRAIAKACSSSHYSSWGPTSKLVMLLALRQDFMAKGMEDQGSEITGLIDCFEPKKELTDPWKFHE